MISLAAVLLIAALAWGVAVLLLGRDPGLEPAEPDGQAVPLPSVRPLTESDLGLVRFDTAPRGYRMAQVDQALHRAAYDIGYKDELIGVLEAEVTALREGRLDEAEALREAREAASRPRPEPEPESEVKPEPEPGLTEPDGSVDSRSVDGVKVNDVKVNDVKVPEEVGMEPDDSVDDDLAAVQSGHTRSEGAVADNRPADGDQ
jgi:DivIVA domain-containing protein